MELKPAIMKDDGKYKVIEITDIALHTAMKTPTPSGGKKIREAFAEDKPNRIYSSIKAFGIEGTNKSVVELLKLDHDFMKLVQEEEAKGFKVLISIPEGGIPGVPGKDMLEFMNSKNGKRALRGIAKHTDKE
jgi:hypothetical protein